MRALLSPIRARWLVVVVAAALGDCTCSPTDDRLDGLPCESDGRCVSGWVCDSGTRTCIRDDECADDDLDGYCRVSDCDSTRPECNTDCEDSDGDGVAACAGDCDDTLAHCVADCTDGDGDGWCQLQDCDDAVPTCTEDCTDGDGDEWCVSDDCDDVEPACNEDCTTDIDGDLERDCTDTCIDVDGDNVGDGTASNNGCMIRTIDSDDSDAMACADTDADGCDDCSQGPWDPAGDGADDDMDGRCDLFDECVDVDGDGVGNGNLANVGCVTDAIDSNDLDPNVCTDTEGDTCDDCDTGTFAPPLDGTNSDSDGFCDAGDFSDFGSTQCADIDMDGCDDCSSGGWNPASDGTDVDGDGVCTSAGSLGDCNDIEPTCARDCDTDDDVDGVADCADACIDRDLDGYGEPGGVVSDCVATDCDDTVPECTTNCVADEDGDTMTDCLEIACGSDPAVLADGCVRADGVGTTLLQAITAANATAGRDKILLTYSHSFTATLTINASDDACVSLRATLPLSVSGSRSALVVDDSGCLLWNLQITGGRDVIVLRGDDNVVRGAHLGPWTDRAGVRIEGDGSQVINSTFREGCGSGSGNDDAAVVVTGDADMTTIAGNVMFENFCSAIQLRNASTNVVIDNNTLARNALHGLESTGTASTGLCVRNNIFFENGSHGVWVNDNTVGWETSACIVPLGNVPEYGNAHAANVVGLCGGNQCAACACLPGGTFWALDPGDPMLDANQCPTNASFVDVAADLGYDLNGDAAQMFNGIAPDIGGRETGSAPCE